MRIKRNELSEQGGVSAYPPEPQRVESARQPQPKNSVSRELAALVMAGEEDSPKQASDERRSVEPKEPKQKEEKRKSRKYRKRDTSDDEKSRSRSREKRSRSRDRSRRKRSRSRDRSRRKRSRGSRSRSRSRSRDRSRRSRRSRSRSRDRSHRRRRSRSRSRRRSRSRSSSSSHSKKGNWDQPPTGQPAPPTLPGPLPLGAVGAAVLPGLLPAIAGVAVPPTIPGVVAPVALPSAGVAIPANSSVDPQTLLQQIAVAQQAASSRQARRIYIGNLPTGVGLTEASLTEFFNQAMIAAGLATVPPVASVWLSTEGKFGFVELRTPPDAQNCLLLDGATLHARQIRVGRPKDFIPGVHDVIANGGVPSAQAMAAAGIPGAAQVLALMGGANAPAANVPILPTPGGPGLAAATPPASTGPTSKVISLANMVKPEELLDEQDYLDLMEDIQTECSKHGSLLEVVIPRPGQPGCGKIYVKYATVEDAQKATGALAGRKFGGNLVMVQFVDEGVFDRRELS